MPLTTQSTAKNLSKTPETYLGSLRGQADTVTLLGDWDVEAEFAKPRKQAQLLLKFTADKVLLVIRPQTDHDRIKVLIDGKVADTGKAGTDVQNGYIKISGEKLYQLIDLKGLNGSHELKLEFEQGSPALYAFTFG